jgi:hypothetical protein
MKQTPFELAHAKEWQEFEAFLDQKKPFDPAEMPSRFRRLCQALALAAQRLDLGLAVFDSVHQLGDDCFVLAYGILLLRLHWAPPSVAPRPLIIARKAEL